MKKICLICLIAGAVFCQKASASLMAPGAPAEQQHKNTSTTQPAESTKVAVQPDKKDIRKKNAKDVIPTQKVLKEEEDDSMIEFLLHPFFRWAKS